MALLVFMWGMGFIAAKAALDAIEPFSLVGIKYCIGIVFLIAMKCIVDRKFPLKAGDIPILLICALFGEVLYFGTEYAAMAYLPVSVITIILAFVPCISIVIEIFLYKNRPTVGIVIGVLASVAGVALVIGADMEEFFQGRYLGYLLAFGAVIFWNVYNFMTKDLSERYSPMDLTLLQQICALILVFPYAISHLPAASVVTPQVIIGVLYLGVVNAFVGFLIYVKAIEVIGPTPCALYSNFLPVITTFLGWIFLKEYISGTQLLGGAIVIAAGAFVIWKKGEEGEIKIGKGKEREGR